MEGWTVLRLGARAFADPTCVGPRIAGLNLLLRLGFPVSPGFCVFPSDRARELSFRGPSPRLHRAVAAAYRRLGGLVAVWSAEGEAPVLFGLAGEEAVWRGVSRCLAAGGGPVFVQRLPDALASGIAYSVDPEDGRPEIALEAMRGLGGLAGEEEGKDRFRLGKRPLLLLSSSISAKARETRAGPMGLVRRPLPPSLRRASSLVEHEALALGRLIRRIEERVGFPVRLGWALTEKGFCFFSFGPVPPPVRDSFYLLSENRGEFTNRRFLATWEIPAEVVTPLTWDLLARAVRAASALVLAGLRLPSVASIPPLVLVDGRVEANFFAVGLEVEQSLGLPPETIISPPESRKRRPLARVYGFFRLAFRLLPSLPWIWKFWRRLEPSARRGAEEMRTAAERLRASCHGEVSPAGLAELLREVDVLLGRYFSALAIGVVAALRFRRFRRLLLRYCGREARAITARLCAGLHPPEEVEWAYGLWALARRLGAEFPPGSDPQEAWEKIVAGGAGRFEAAVALDSLAAAYAHVGPGWMELANPRWSEDLHATVGELFSLMGLGAEETAPEEHRRRLAAARSQAVVWVEGRLATGWRKIFFWRRRRLLRAKRKMATACELLAEVHGGMARFFAASRRLALLAGEELVRAGYLGRPDEVFFLRLDEVRACLLGTADPKRIEALRTERTETWERYREMAREALPAAEKKEAALTGVAASPGRVVGRAFLVRSPADFSSFPCGAVLVAGNVDYGWAPLFLRAAGVVTEEGGEMSPPAVLAREFGLPAVVGVKGLLDSVAEGDLLELDGTAGRILIRPE
ncbi:MAG: PEP-utilizing enzyme [Bacillota bacterium]